MSQTALLEIAGRLMRCPAVAYHEFASRAAAMEICREHGLGHELDAQGNLFVRLQTKRRLRPLVFAAHLDHPGFEIVGEPGRGRWPARFLGGVPDEYFREGVPLRLMPGAQPATLGRCLGQEKIFELHAAEEFPQKPVFAVWELEDFALRRGRIHGRACDDLIGCAAALTALVELKQIKADVNVIAVLARAEEVGFHGALTVAAARRLPANSLVVSLETSRELPPAKMGRGVIVRVGDRASIFDSTATRFLSETAAGLQAREPRFCFQRALMSGGTCEGTAYQEFGYQTAALCVALGNYHNCGANHKIAAEFVSLADAVGMAGLLVEAARQMPNYKRLVQRLPTRLRGLLTEARAGFALRRQAASTRVT